MSENRVNYGLKNVHYSKITVENTKTVYHPPVRISGGVELSLEPQGDLTPFYADDIVYYITSSNNGYEGALTIANIPKQFAIDCLGEVEDTDHGVITEIVNGKKHNFALMFEFDGDIKATRHIIYNCTANRPTVGGSTKTDTAEPFTNELPFNSMPREDLRVKTKTFPDTPEHIYDAWYRKAYDGIKNTTPRSAPTFSKGTNAGQNQTFVINSSEDVTVTGVTNNGVSLGNSPTNWEYDAARNTLTIKATYLASLNNTTVGNEYNIIALTDKGNDVLIKLTVTA